MKTIILVRHSEPQRGTSLPNETIPLSGKGRELAKRFFSVHPIFEGCHSVYTSPYARAAETAEYFPGRVIGDDRLVERALGDPESLDAHFWAKQYEDLDFKNRSGESLREVSQRMDDCVSDILREMADGEKAAAVSHAAAICAYLTKFCSVTVVNGAEKIRRIQFGNEIIMEGKIDTPSAFILQYDLDKPTEISYIS